MNECQNKQAELVDQGSATWEAFCMLMWCTSHNLDLHIKNTKELIVDFRKSKGTADLFTLSCPLVELHNNSCLPPTPQTHPW
ncbi:hypothetical protein NQZ68_000882 [Dissostichus eleginoides]|nr:hypothetical protein NQZ68_000882 [Dissostichus eleginoides]